MSQSRLSLLLMYIIFISTIEILFWMTIAKELVYGYFSIEEQVAIAECVSLWSYYMEFSEFILNYYNVPVWHH